MNKFCFGAIYNGRLWEKELRVAALFVHDYYHEGRVTVSITINVDYPTSTTCKAAVAPIVGFLKGSHVSKALTDLTFSSLLRYDIAALEPLAS